MRKRLGPSLGLTLLLTGLFVVLPAPPAAACSCAIGTDDEAIERADAVFSGRLLDRKDPGFLSGGSSADFSTLRFEVDAVYEGDVAIDQVVVTEQSGASCGLEIEGEGPFLVFAQASHYDQEVPDGAVYAGLCGGTRPLAEGNVPASFGDARPPTPPPGGGEPATTAPSSDDDDGAHLLFIGGLVAVTVAIGGAIVLLGRRRSADPAV